MVSGEVDDYCSFTKAVEHLGDRWSLLIVADLVLFGPQGFNALAAGLPGRISRSVLADRLRRLEDLGIIARTGARGRQDPYGLTAAGEGLAPAVRSLRAWATDWLPDDPGMVDRDPQVVVTWLVRTVDRSSLPVRRVVLEFRMRHDGVRRCWVVLQRDNAPYGCLEDPLLDEASYLHVDAASTALLALARGRLDWATALADGSVVLSGDPRLVKSVPGWFATGDGRMSIVVSPVLGLHT